MKKIIAVCMCGLMVATLTTEYSKKVAVDSVKPGRYKGVSYIPVPVEVTDEQVEAEIQGLLDEHAMETEVDRVTKEGDIVNIDFVSTRDGVTLEDGVSSDYDLRLGSGSFINGLEDGLVNAVKGQGLSLSLTFSGPYPNNEELVKQDVVFGIAVSAVKESKPAELNNAFIKENTESAMIDEYRKVTRENLSAAVQTDADDRKKSEVFQKVVDSLEITVTDVTADTYYSKQLSNYESQVSQAGIDLEAMVSYYGPNLDTFKSQLRATSEETSKQNLVVKAIADAERIAIVEEGKDTLTTELDYTDKDNMVEMVGGTIVNDYILTKKVVSLIVDNAVEA